jgi:hypothetical protein
LSYQVEEYHRFPSVRVGLFVFPALDLFIQEEILEELSDGLSDSSPSPSTSIASSQTFGESSKGSNGPAAYAPGINSGASK